MPLIACEATIAQVRGVKPRVMVWSVTKERTVASSCESMAWTAASTAFTTVPQKYILMLCVINGSGFCFMMSSLYTLANPLFKQYSSMPTTPAGVINTEEGSHCPPSPAPCFKPDSVFSTPANES